MSDSPGRRRPAPDRPHSDRPHSDRLHHDDERGLRGLVGAGPTQINVTAAMRARDAARPTADDEAAAERDLRLVHRNYVPPASGSSGSTRDRS